MDRGRRTQFELVGILVLLTAFAFTMMQALRNMGILGRSHGPSPVVEAMTTASTRLAANADSAVKPPAAAAPTDSSESTASDTQTRAAAQTSQRAGIHYTAASFRDPLISLLPTEPARQTGAMAIEPVERAVEPPAVTVQGILWGGSHPQAIIDGQVYRVGDDVRGAQITAIDQNGVTVELRGAQFQLTTATSHDKMLSRK